MKEMDYSRFDKQVERREIDLLFSESTHEVPANRKARRDAMRRKGMFKHRGKRWS